MKKYGIVLAVILFGFAQFAFAENCPSNTAKIIKDSKAERIAITELYFKFSNGDDPVRIIQDGIYGFLDQITMYKKSDGSKVFNYVRSLWIYIDYESGTASYKLIAMGLKSIKDYMCVDSYVNVTARYKRFESQAKKRGQCITQFYFNYETAERRVNFYDCVIIES